MAEVKRQSLTSRVVKAMSVFGGVQVISILCSIIRTKCVAIWLGAAGFGLFGIYNNVLEMIVTFSQMSIRNSAVRNIAGAKTPGAVARVACVVRRWSFALGIVGAFLTLIFSPLLSDIAFGDTSHTVPFILLAAAVFINNASSGEAAILQGTDHLNRLARASVYGIVGGLAVSIPMFRFLGIDSIIPSILAYAFITSGSYFAMRVRFRGEATVKPTPRQTFREGLDIVRLGFFLTFSSFVSLAMSFLLIAWLNRTGGTTLAGYFQAGYTIVNRYIGLIFMAISMEYFPRLSRVTDSLRRTATFVNHEILLTITILIPAIAWVTALNDIIIDILYDSSFYISVPYVTAAVSGTIFRTVGWCIGYVILSRGDGRLYVATEIFSSIVFLVSSIIGYKLGGLDGMGWGYVVWLGLYALLLVIIYYYHYHIRLSRGVVATIVAATIVAVVCTVTRFAGMRAVTIVIAVAATIYSIYRLRQLMH